MLSFEMLNLSETDTKHNTQYSLQVNIVSHHKDWNAPKAVKSIEIMFEHIIQ